MLNLLLRQHRRQLKLAAVVPAGPGHAGLLDAVDACPASHSRDTLLSIFHHNSSTLSVREVPTAFLCHIRMSYISAIQ